MTPAESANEIRNALEVLNNAIIESAKFNIKVELYKTPIALHKIGDKRSHYTYEAKITMGL